MQVTTPRNPFIQPGFAQVISSAQMAIATEVGKLHFKSTQVLTFAWVENKSCCAGNSILFYLNLLLSLVYIMNSKSSGLKRARG